MSELLPLQKAWLFSLRDGWLTREQWAETLDRLFSDGWFEDGNAKEVEAMSDHEIGMLWYTTSDKFPQDEWNRKLHRLAVDQIDRRSLDCLSEAG